MFCLFCIQQAKFLLKIHIAQFVWKRLVTVQRQNKAAVQVPETTAQSRNFLCDPDPITQGGIYPPADKVAAHLVSAYSQRRENLFNQRLLILP